MKLRIKNKLITLLAMNISLVLSGSIHGEIKEMNLNLNDSNNTLIIEEASENILDIKPKEEKDYVKAINNTFVYDVDGNIIGKLVEDRSIPLLESYDDNTYQVDYYGKYGYVNKQDVITLTRPVFNVDMIAKGYLPNEAVIYSDETLENKLDTLNSLEFVEIYKELDDCYLVQTIDTEGYISKKDVTLIEGNIAVVDISNQEMRFYENNDMTVITPVVTGTKDTDRESDLGLFNVGVQAENLEIVPGAWVDCVDYYNGGEGIHTAGWRSESEFGGDTYLTNGSHGCINTPHDEAIYIHEHIESGDSVLVKR